MEAKKTQRADLQNRRLLFIEIGLVIALVAVVGAFSWGQTEKKVEAMVDNTAPVEEDVIINTEQSTPPPPARPQPQEVFSDLINVVRDDAQITTEYNFDEFSEDVVIEVPQVVEEVVEDVPVYITDEMPTFQGGGLDVFRNWVLDHTKYPVNARENGIQGKVNLSFIIERDGTLTNIEELSSPDRDLTAEAIRVLKTSPKWEPGKQRNRPVRVCFILPVDFMLTNN